MDAYQGGNAFQVYSPQGSKPLESLRVTGGTVRKEYDKPSKSQVVTMEQVSSKIVVPRVPKTGALLVHPVVVVQLFVSHATTLLSVEFAVVDQLGKRRLTFSNSFATIQPNPQHCKFPLQTFPRNQWLDLIFDVRQLHHNVYETRASVGFRGVESITLSGAHVRVRRIYTLREVPPISAAPQTSTSPQQQQHDGGIAQRRGIGAGAHQQGGLYHMHVPSQFTLPADVEQTQILIARGDELAPVTVVAEAATGVALPRVNSGGKAQQQQQQQSSPAPHNVGRGGLGSVPRGQQQQLGTPRTGGGVAGGGAHVLPKKASPGVAASGSGRYLDPLSAQPLTTTSPTPSSSTSVVAYPHVDGDDDLSLVTSDRHYQLTSQQFNRRSFVNSRGGGGRGVGGSTFGGSSAGGPGVLTGGTLPYHRLHVDVAAEEEALFHMGGAHGAQVVSVHEHPALMMMTTMATQKVSYDGETHHRDAAPSVCRSFLGPTHTSREVERSHYADERMAAVEAEEARVGGFASSVASTTASHHYVVQTSHHHHHVAQQQQQQQQQEHELQTAGDGSHYGSIKGHKHVFPTTRNSSSSQHRASMITAGSDSEAEEFVVQHHVSSSNRRVVEGDNLYDRSSGNGNYQETHLPPLHHHHHDRHHLPLRSGASATSVTMSPARDEEHADETFGGRPSWQQQRDDDRNLTQASGGGGVAAFSATPVNASVESAMMMTRASPDGDDADDDDYARDDNDRQATHRREDFNRSAKKSSHGSSGGTTGHRQQEPPSIEGSHRQHRKGNTPSQPHHQTLLSRPPADPLLACSTASSLVAARALFSSSTMVVEEAEAMDSMDADTVRRLRMSVGASADIGGGPQQNLRHHTTDQERSLRNAALDALQHFGHHSHVHQRQSSKTERWGDGYGRGQLAATTTYNGANEILAHQSQQQEHLLHDPQNYGGSAGQYDDSGKQHSSSFHFPKYNVSPPSTASGAIRYDGISDGDDDIDGSALQGTRACVDTDAYFYPPRGSSSSDSASGSSNENGESRKEGGRPPVVEVAMPRHPNASLSATSHHNSSQSSTRSPIYGDLQNNPPQSFSSAMSSSTERIQYEEMLAAQKKAAVLDAASQPWTAPPSRRGPSTLSAMAAASPLSPPPPVRISQELGAAGSSPPHPVAYEEDKDRYEYDPVVGCYFDRVANRFVKPPSTKHRQGAQQHQHQQQPPAQEVSGGAAERGASPGQRVPPRRPLY